MAFVGRNRWSRRTSFWFVVAAQVLLFAGSNFPTPLFPIYEDRYGFGSGTVTLLFGVYVLVLVPTLVLLGPVADRFGRRPLLVVGIALTVLSSVAFALARGVAWLFAGEIIYGVGAGMVMACVAAAIRELHPAQDGAGAALAGSVAMAAGLTLGPLVSGGLASATPWPTVSPYVVDIVLASILAGLLARIPEPRSETSGSVARLRALHVPGGIRRGPFVNAAAAGAASFMVVGWVFGLSPSYLHEELHVHITEPVVAGLFAAVVVAMNGVAQLAFRRFRSPGSMRIALAGVVVGMGVMASSTLVDSLLVAVAGALIAGLGTGVAQMNAMATIQHVAPAHSRAAVTSAYFTACYLGLSVPVVVAGVAADRFGLGAVTYAFFAALTAFVGVLLVWARHVADPATGAEAELIELSRDADRLRRIA
jgi:MFS family permease